MYNKHLDDWPVCMNYERFTRSCAEEMLLTDLCAWPVVSYIEGWMSHIDEGVCASSCFSECTQNASFGGTWTVAMSCAGALNPRHSGLGVRRTWFLEYCDWIYVVCWRTTTTVTPVLGPFVIRHIFTVVFESQWTECRVKAELLSKIGGTWSNTQAD
jgi:hypothetical protein